MNIKLASIAILLLGGGCAVHEQTSSIAYHPGPTALSRYENSLSAEITSSEARSGTADRAGSAADIVYLEEFPKDKGETEQDREIIRRIREALRMNYALSLDAPNVVLHVSDGKVSMEGRVRTEGERSVMDFIASRTPGVTGVKNSVEVVTPS